MASDYLLNKLAAVISEATHVSLHTADPGTTGASEVTGGAPAYARVAISSWAPHGSLAGVYVATLAGPFNVPASTDVVWAGLWNGTQWLDKAPAMVSTIAQDTVTITTLNFVVPEAA